jgi:aerobic C4-dicarboxylate transport protein
MTSPAAAAAQDRPRRRLYTQLWFWVLIAIAAGIVFGLVAPDTAKKAKWLAEALIQVIKAVTGPVVFTTVVIGIASIGNLARAGGLALRALGYFLVMTIVALALGLVAGNLIAPGSGFSGHPGAEAAASAKEQIGSAGEQGLIPFLTDHVLPTSFVEPFVENEILRILVLGIVTAAAISVLADAERRKVVGVFEVVARIIFGIIRIVMWAAPIGAFGGMAYTVAAFGSASLANLGLLMLTFWGTCLVFVCVSSGSSRVQAGSTSSA